MSRQSSWVAMAAVVATAGVVACGSPETETEAEGRVQVVVKGLSSLDISHLVVTAQPADVTQTFRRDPASGLLQDTLVLPVGEQTLTVKAYAPPSGLDAGYPSPSDGGSGGFDGGYDAGPGGFDAGSPGAGSLVEVASGTATVTIVANTTTAVTILLYDQTPAPPQGDIPPMILSLQVSNSRPAAGEVITLRVEAVDLDDGVDALSYLWTSNCPDSTFSAPAAASTTWSTPTMNACTLRVTVFSGDRSASSEVDVFATGDGTQGVVEVTAEYVPRPVVTTMVLRHEVCCGPPSYSSYVSRDGLPYYPYYPYYPAAMFAPVTAGVTYSLEVTVRSGGSGALSTAVTDTCGAPLVKQSYGAYCYPTYEGNTCYEMYSWTAPAPGKACMLTATAASGTLSDSFAVGVQVQ